MANEKMVCNQICRWNAPSSRCILPAHAICPMSNTEPDASGWGQVQENKKRLLCKKCDHYLVCKYADNETEECSQYKAYTVDAVEVGSDATAAGGGKRERSEWPGSADDAGVRTKEVAGHPNRTHGRWIEKVDMVESYLADCTEVFYECSVCESANLGESPYCPCCGAKMDGGNEDG